MKEKRSVVDAQPVMQFALEEQLAWWKMMKDLRIRL